MSVISYKFDCKRKSLKRCRCIDEMSAEKSNEQNCSSTELISNQYSVKEKKFIVDCSNTYLTSVPKEIPIRVTHLYLDDNSITALRDKSFEQQLPNLVLLSLKGNNLNKIGDNVFKFLPRLRVLDLYDNNINSLSNSVLKPLSKTLEKLDIGMNFNTYSTVSFEYFMSLVELTNLVELQMDIIRNKPLPKEYSQLKHLQKLSFVGGGRHIQFIRNDMFHSIKSLNITEVSLVGLKLHIIRNETFLKTPKLKILDISNNPGLGVHLADIAPSLRKTSIQTLRLNNTGIGNTYESVTEILTRFCDLRLKELILDSNFIRDLEPIFNSTCFRELEILSLAENCLVESINLTYNIFTIKHLVGLNMSSRCRVDENRAMIPSITKQRISKRAIDICGPGMACPIILPSKMKWIDLSHSGIHISQVPELVLLRNCTLNNLRVSYTGLRTIQFPIYCAFNVLFPLETVDFSNNGLKCINESSFDQSATNCDWSSVKYFYLNNNNLGKISGNICNRNKQNILGFLKPLSGLEVLDLSHNMIETRHSLTPLSNLSNLKFLDLSSNMLHNFSLDLNNLSSLVKLKLENNNLKYLSQGTTKQLDKLQASRQNSSCLEVDLSGNVFSCLCPDLYFLNWMTKTKIVLLNKENYQCEFNDGVTTNMHNIQLVIAKLESQCYSYIWLKVYISSQCLVYFLISVISLLYRFRHDIRYLFLKLKLNRHKLRNLLNPKQYTYSAFVSCVRIDCRKFVIQKLLPNLETEEMRFKFCIAQRNFVVGVTIIDNIMRAIDNSKRVIFIISKAFLDSGWRKEELRIAHRVCCQVLSYLKVCFFFYKEIFTSTIYC